MKIVLCLLAFASSSFAQQATIPLESWKEAGLPYIQNFDPKEYQAGAQNWYITQDKRGIMYFGNEQGMLILVVKSPVLAKCRGLAFAFKHDNIPSNDPSSILYSF